MGLSELVGIADCMREGALDEMVHDAKASEAAAINNSGVEAQVEYLLTCNAEATLRGVFRLAEAEEDDEDG